MQSYVSKGNYEKTVQKRKKKVLFSESTYNTVFLGLGFKNNIVQMMAILTAVPPSGIVWSSDEVHFHLCGAVNKQNFRYWTAENPRQLHQ